MRTLLSKRPWEVVLPGPEESPLQTKPIVQDEFIRQYYPSGHKIKDPMYYPDIWRQIEEPVLDAEGNDTGKTVVNTYVEKVPRVAFAYQQLITLKHLVHLCGNDVQFDLRNSKASETMEADAQEFRDAWLDKNMEYAFYKFQKSVKITGDAAFVAYLENGKFGWEVLSFLDRDRLYPHYGKDGKLVVFARGYNEYTADGKVINRLEVMDKTHLYRLHKATDTNERPNTLTFGRGADTYTLDGYVYDNPSVGAEPHGFPCVPVVYERNEDGPCWGPSQECIEEYEVSYSQMAHNNKMYGEPILYLKGDNVEANHDMNGTIKTMTMGPDDEAGYLAGQSASDSYMKQHEQLHSAIFELSFVVTPPELKSGDLPAAALKILYSPAVEKGMDDSQISTPALDGIVYLFSYGYGIEVRKTLTFVNLPLRPWVKPYIHVNESAIMADLATGVQNRFISRRTATERASFYAVATEFDRITAEQKEEERNDLLAEFERQRFGTNTDE